VQTLNVETLERSQSRFTFIAGLQVKVLLLVN